MKFTACLAIALIVVAPAAFACDGPVAVCFKPSRNNFELIVKGQPATLLIEPSANPAVKIAAKNFADDLERVGGKAPRQVSDQSMSSGPLIIAGVVGQSAAIDDLARAGKIRVADLAGQWEAYRQIVVEQPFKNVPRALVIAGSDRRGVVFGLYDLSAKIGVSPWYWFADVPVTHQDFMYLTAGTRGDQPKVRYRGFFINDEAPAFSTWAQKHFGGANHEMYAHVFELLLRLKGNYLWPAMWAPRAFNDDDPQNMVLADSMGVVMGTSHHEPMTRAQAEWHRNQDKGVTGGKWDYTVNAGNLRKFWRGGIERMWNGGKPYECLVTVGMRGDGDEPMSEGTATQLLESVVAAQRDIIRDVTGRPAELQPQVWALYKEVQDYYDHGMKVPDDVTLLFADDNWGQIRRLPTADLNRKGGYGVYYHFDYVGGPRNYKWLNTNQIEKTWQQMDLAWQRGARNLWIVNVGDIKPMEFPLSFFMAQAWDPQAMTLDAMTDYPAKWATVTLSQRDGAQIGKLLTRYSQLAAWRKPELVDENSFPLGEDTPGRPGGGGFKDMVDRWGKLETDNMMVRSAAMLGRKPDAYVELVEHPIQAMSNLYRLYYDVARNRQLAAAGDARANALADAAEAAFKHDQELTDRYHALAGGKWDGMMLQTHIGYTSWKEPDKQVMPAIRRVEEGHGSTPSSAEPQPQPANLNGAIVVEATSFKKAYGGKQFTWRAIPNLGHGDGALVALPQGRPSTTQADAVYVEYPVKIPYADDATLQLHMVPTLDTNGGVDVRIGVSIDDAPMQTLSMRLTPSPGPAKTEDTHNWEQAVIDNDFVLAATFAKLAAGKHTIKVWRLDDNALVSRLVLVPKTAHAPRG